MSYLKKKRGRIIEFYGEIGCKDPKRHRIIEFWNKTDKKYHWYVTNLDVSSSAIYITLSKSTSAYYDRCHRPKSRRTLKNEDLTELVKAVFES